MLSACVPFQISLITLETKTPWRRPVSIGSVAGNVTISPLLCIRNLLSCFDQQAVSTGRLYLWAGMPARDRSSDTPEATVELQGAWPGYVSYKTSLQIYIVMLIILVVVKPMLNVQQNDRPEMEWSEAWLSDVVLSTCHVCFDTAHHSVPAGQPAGQLQHIWRSQ